MARRHDVNTNACLIQPAKTKLLECSGRARASSPCPCSPSRAARNLALVLLILISSLPGCSTLRLPAIDPSGNRIFLPRPNATTLTLPRLHPTNEAPGIIPVPSFREPPPPPACLQGPSIAPSVKPAGHLLNHHRATPDRGRCGELLLTPTRIVAPVNGDVVLLSGICGEDGFLVSGETIEWMISPDSVGQIVEVGDDGATSNNGLFYKTESAVKKLGVDFARGVTASNDRVITRGSAKITDDLPVKKGQTWISLTSPSEGITRLTALAPDAEVWDKRRQTATIYWVDARWQFPAPISQIGTAPATLITRVTRAEGFAPAENWIVRYRSLNPEIGLFAPNNLDVIESRVDADGKAVVTLNNVSGRTGTALVGIEIVRPAQNSENIPELPLGRGQAIVSWSSSELFLQANGPPAGGVGETLTYTASLANVGDLPGENVRVTASIPAGMQLVSASPQPSQQSPSALAWDLGQLPARQQFAVTLQLNATADSDYRVQFDATSSGGSAVRQMASTLVTSPKLTLRFQPASGYEQVEVGQEVPMQLTVRNDGRTSIGSVTITIESDEGLQHSADNSNRVSRTITYLSPGEFRSLNPSFTARRTGNLRATAIASSGAVELARQSTAVEVVQAAVRSPALSIQLQSATGDESVSTDQPLRTAAIIRNSGQVRLENIQVAITYSNSLSPLQGSAGVVDLEAQRQLVWTLPFLEVGGTNQVRADFQFDGSEPAPRITATAATSAAVRADAVLNLRPTRGAQPNNSPSEVLPSRDILPNSDVLPDRNVVPNRDARPNPNREVLPGSANNGATGRGWILTLEPVRSQVRTGNVARYSLRIRNDRSTADQNASVVLQLQPGILLRGVTTPDGQRVNYNYASDGSSLTFETIQFIAPNETISYFVDLQHEIPGQVAIRALLRSALDSQGVQATSTIDVGNF